MLSNEKSMNKLTTVSRMLAYQKQSNKEEAITDSFIVLRKKLSPSYSTSIDELESFSQGNTETLIKYQHGPFQLLSILLKKVIDYKGNVGGVLINTQNTLQDTISEIKEQWEGFNSLVFYSIIIMAFLVIILGIYTEKIHPTFAEVYSSFGAELPTLTKIIITNGFAIKGGIFLILLLIAGLIFMAYHIKRQIFLLLPLSKKLDYIPGIRSLYKAYSYFLFVHYIKLLQGAELSTSSSIEIARDLSEFNSSDQFDEWLDALLMADELAAFEQENQYQCDQIKAVLNQQLLRARESINLCIQLSLGVIVAVLAASVYLPIFSLSSVV